MFGLEGLFAENGNGTHRPKPEEKKPPQPKKPKPERPKPGDGKPWEK